MAQYKIGEGTLFEVGDKVYYRIPADPNLRRADGTLRFPGGFAEVTCVITHVAYDVNPKTGTENKNCHEDSRYTLLVTRRTLSFQRGDVFHTSGNHFSRKRATVPDPTKASGKRPVGNGRRRAPKKRQLTPEERRLAIKVAIALGPEGMRVAHELNI